MTIKNYNSTLSLSNYTLGDAYVFYVHNNHYNILCVADAATINKYSGVLTEIIDEGTYNDNNGKWAACTRVIGVVVDKEAAASNKDIDTITVMFKTDRDDYVTMKYVVNADNVLTNNKEKVPPSAVRRTV